MNRSRHCEEQTHNANDQAGDGHRKEEEDSAEESFKDVIDDVLDASGE
jgi:hypothetical protein